MWRSEPTGKEGSEEAHARSEDRLLRAWCGVRGTVRRGRRGRVLWCGSRVGERVRCVPAHLHLFRLRAKLFSCCPPWCFVPVFSFRG